MVWNLDDRQLIALLQNDPERGIKEAIGQYGGLCKAIVRRILGNRRRDVEECVSDVFVGLWRQAGSIDFEKGSMKAYIASIARNKAISRLRSENRADEILPLEENSLPVDLDLSSQLMQSELTELLRRMLAELPHPDREIFIRRYYYCERVKDIAKKLGLSPKVVENKLFRGRRKLKNALLLAGGEGFETPKERNAAIG